MTIAIVNPSSSNGPEKTIVIFGLGRGGTSALAGSLRLMGMAMPVDRTHPMKHEWSPIVYANESVDRSKTYDAIQEMNQQFPIWGWKSPGDVFSVSQYESMLRNPYFIVVFRNILDVMTATRKYEGIEIEASIHDIVKALGAIARFTTSALSPLAAISFEAMISDPRRSLKSLANWIGIDASEDAIEKCVQFLSTGSYRPLDGVGKIGEEELRRDTDSAQVRIYSQEIEKLQTMIGIMDTDIAAARKIVRRVSIVDNGTGECLRDEFRRLRKEYMECGAVRLELQRRLDELSKVKGTGN